MAALKEKDRPALAALRRRDPVLLDAQLEPEEALARDAAAAYAAERELSGCVVLAVPAVAR